MSIEYMGEENGSQQTNEERSHNRPTLPRDELIHRHDATTHATTHLHKTSTIRLKVDQQSVATRNVSQLVT